MSKICKLCGKKNQDNESSAEKNQSSRHKKSFGIIEEEQTEGFLGRKE